jgi:2-oxoglutarate ferredoxin oxidoreductase subunit delta
MFKKKFNYLSDENDKVKVIRFPELCKSCGLCLGICPVGAISWDVDNLGVYNLPAVKISMDKCIGCGLCQNVCPELAIEIKNKLKYKDIDNAVGNNIDNGIYNDSNKKQNKKAASKKTDCKGRK